MTKPTKPKTPPVPVAPPPTFEEGLIVGLLMARGSFTGDRYMGRLSILGNDLEMLQWLRSRIGGTISGPFADRDRNPRHMYQLSGAALQPVIELLSAYMPTGLQRTKYLKWIERYWTKGRRIVNNKTHETT
jgi:hypothetical protein